MKHTILCAACASLLIAASGVAQAAAISGQGTWETTLQGRDLDGNLATFEAYYDAALDITWMRDANYANTTGYTTGGRMTWSVANDWAENLNPYGSGITGWRLPTVTDTGAPGCDYAFSGTDCGWNVDTATGEMAQLFYTTLGDLAIYDALGDLQPGSGLTNSGPFSIRVADVYYWSATEYATDTTQAWHFYFGSGARGYNTKASELYAWAVHDGDVGTSVVPMPAAVWLFGSGLLALIGIAKKKGA